MTACIKIGSTLKRSVYDGVFVDYFEKGTMSILSILCGSFLLTLEQENALKFLPGFIPILSYVGWGKRKFDYEHWKHFSVKSYLNIDVPVFMYDLLVFGLSLFNFPFSHDLAATREGYCWREDLR